MRLLLLIVSILFLNCLYAQTKFKVRQDETETWRSIYSLIDEKGKQLRVLDSSKYIMSFTIDNYGYFAVFVKKGFPGWVAIDTNENILFEVYNTSHGEPSPDYLIENKIRIIDGDAKIGFANEKGEVIIKPQFEIVTSFHNGKAIIGEKCRKVPWNAHENEGDCQHFSIVCERYGYINDKGEILKIGDYSFDDIMKEIDWKPHDPY